MRMWVVVVKPKRTVSQVDQAPGVRSGIGTNEDDRQARASGKWERRGVRAFGLERDQEGWAATGEDNGMHRAPAFV